ncbi:hypothetical protein [Vibrio gallicus]|uniref:hypothetical protein n=1 Tax=Vibrio gallicus TaxID=190897 RepID=UPI0021C44E2F|nr:hypothetical protein [Vibrio gallicus]
MNSKFWLTLSVMTLLTACSDNNDNNDNNDNDTPEPTTDTFTPDVINTERQTLSPENNRARQASAAYNSTDHHFMIIWNDNTYNPDLETIEARLVNYDGTLGEPIILEESTTIDLADPTISYNSIENTFLTAWESPVATSTNQSLDKLRLAVLDGQGTIIKESLLDIGCEHGDASIAYNDKLNKWLLVWVHDLNNGNDCSADPSIGGVYAQYINTDGQPEGEPTLIRQAFDSNNILGQRSTDELTGSQLEYNSENNQYLVAWQHNYVTIQSETPIIFSELFNGLEGQRIDANLGHVGDLFIIDSDSGKDVGEGARTFDDPQEISLAYSPDSNIYAMAYRSRDVSTIDVDDSIISKINVRTLSAQGVLSGITIVAQVAEGEGDYSDTAVDEPSIGYNPASQDFLVTWQQSPASEVVENYDYDIYSSVISNNATASTPSVISDTSGINDMKADDIHEDIVCNVYACLVLWQQVGALRSDGEEVIPRTINFKFINNLN